MTPLGRVINFLLQRPLRMRKDLGRAAKPHGATDVIPAHGAVLTRLARDADLEGHLVAHPQLGGGLIPNGDDGAGGLVAQGQGLLHGNVADGEMVEVVQV